MDENDIKGEKDMIKLWENTPGYDATSGQDEPNLIPYIVESDKAIIVCPGGAYRIHARGHEGVDICEWLNSIGYSAYLLSYRLTPYRHTLITNDIFRAIRVARADAKKYNIEKIGVLGFSAAGHLCSSAAVHFEDAICDENDPIDSESSRPDFAVLCYPVISSDDDIANKGSFENLLGEEMTPELLHYYSNEKQVKDNTPPVFLWHTATDEAVPVQNSLEFAKALAKKKIPFELHIYPEGRHGLGLAKGLHPESWADALEKWLETV